MSFSDQQIDLLRAILAENCGTDEAARHHLRAAAALGMDPLDYCAHQFGLGNAVVWRRAAQWAGYVFADALPSHPALPAARIDHLDRLGERRTLRMQALDQDISFVAPGFVQIVSLKQSRTDEMARGIRFAPPEAIEMAVARAASEQLMEEARQRITQLWPHASAAVDLPLHARVSFVVVLGALIVLAMAAGLIWRPGLVPLVAVLLMAPGLMRLAAAFPGPPPPSPPPLPEADLPLYTVLIPLRDESQMVPMLKRAMLALDYPPHRLDIKFVVEAKSPETVAAVRQALGDPQFRMVVVPPGPPHTKPKAIDYALPLARGEFLVVYDAEDVPEPQQLRLAAARFAADPGLACLQAELVPENAHENVLTALFAGEYAGLFGRLLPALARWGLPVPLGGTSNHFRGLMYQTHQAYA